MFRSDKEKFWALEDIDFKVEAGESIGIIGRNGAGKSTLLKIMSRITPPTIGEIKLRGRVASLLEVGTGFHPELTGRENIFFNGSILGMKNIEIKRKFDEIVDFSGVESFIDTPLKHYSSGMQMRLAFSVAAHLDSEILLIDEVLAVGDTEFQKKCIGKMDDVSKGEGKTILFVSHDIKMISIFCKNGILLSDGKYKLFGSIPKIIDQYTKEGLNLNGLNRNNYINSFSNILYFTNLQILKFENNKGLNTFEFNVKFKLLLKVPIKEIFINLIIHNSLNSKIGWMTTKNFETCINFYHGELSLFIEDIPLIPAVYRCSLYSEVNNEISDWVIDAAEFNIDHKITDTLYAVPYGNGDINLKYKVIQKGKL
ncbi:MAG: ABC transporter ATP-binding protein [Saprospiraceae bacterium]|nr:ABC transporter ATP-binding protein [Saprospiraceae bacterium]